MGPMRVTQPFDPCRGERCDRLDAEVEQAGGNTSGLILPRLLAGETPGHIAD